jgi:hypothetical protein
VSDATVVLERHSRVTPLGIRFWDDATHSAIDRLAVEVYPVGDPQRRATARPNRIGTFVLPQLPGPRDVSSEFGAGDDAFWQGVKRRPYVIEVSDPAGDYQPFRFEQRLPTRGHAVPDCLPVTSPPSEVVPLFSTVSRRVPAGMAVVRAELRVARTNEPASWALVDVQAGTTTSVRGVADREGRVAVLLPYPEPIASPARPSSPPFGAGTSLRDQHWPVRMAVAYEPLTPAPQVPDLCRVVQQPPAFAWADAAATVPLGDSDLQYGRELAIGSVFVTTATSPP